MLRYDRIDSIEQEYLAKYLVPDKKGVEVFNLVADCEKAIEYKGRTYTVHFDLSEGLNEIWKDYAYDLVGSWEGVQENSRRFSTPGWESRPEDDNGYLKLLEERTYCRDWEHIRNPLLERMPELTHEQVRQRVLCFVAACDQAQDEQAIHKMIDLYPFGKTNRPLKNRFVEIVRLNISGLFCKYRLCITAESHDRFRVFIEYFDKLADTPEEANELFDFPMRTAILYESPNETVFEVGGRRIRLKIVNMSQTKHDDNNVSNEQKETLDE